MNILNTSQRVFGLDFIRAVAILSVVLGHCSFMLDKTSPGFPDIPLLNGVDLFFVLSGFLIGNILIRIFEEEKKVSWKSLLNFWIRRWFRTLPLYYLILLANVLLAYFHIINDDIKEFNISFIFFLHNFAWPYQGFFWESWSLSVEEWFYILFPLLSVILTRVISSLSVRQLFLTGILFFIIAPSLLRIITSPVMPTDNYMFGIMIHKVVIYRLDSIMYGVLGAYLSFYYADFWRKYRYVFLVLGLIIVYGQILHSAHDASLWYYRTIYYNISGLGLLMLFPFFSSVKEIKNTWFNMRFIEKVITHISKISYAMYLLNLGLASVIMKNVVLNTTAEEVSMYIGYWIILFILSSLLYYFFEKPITALRERAVLK